LVGDGNLYCLSIAIPWFEENIEWNLDLTNTFLLILFRFNNCEFFILFLLLLLWIVLRSNDWLIDLFLISDELLINELLSYTNCDGLNAFYRYDLELI
jgi:hypothetical protein